MNYSITSNDIYLFLHLVFLVIGFGAVIVTDVFGFLLLIKKVALRSVVKITHTTQVLIWLGWSGLVVTGVKLLVDNGGNVSNLTAIKIFFVVLLAFNGIFLHTIKHSMIGYEEMTDLSFKTKYRICLGTVLSQIGWWGAILIGYFNHEVKRGVQWPSQPYTVMGLFLVVAIALFLIGEFISSRKNAKISKNDKVLE